MVIGMISYRPLWILLATRKLKNADVARMAGISRTTLTKLTNDYAVNLDIIDRLCSSLNCQTGDVTEYVPGPQPHPVGKGSGTPVKD
jgi:putative transcriptional regulator